MDMIAHDDITVYSHALIFNAEIQTVNTTIPIVFSSKNINSIYYCGCNKMSFFLFSYNVSFFHGV